MKVYILGCGSALPTLKHNPSSQLVESRDKFFMVDCGEGTQIAFRHTKVNFNKLQSIFISHLHGDHCLGLVGMICTFGLLGRIKPLHIFGPAPLERMLKEQVAFYAPGLEYEVVVHEHDTTKSQVIYEDRTISVTTIPLQHRVPCAGFLFQEKPTRKQLETGEQPKSYAYCSDTKYLPELHKLVKGVDLLYHESTYGSEREDSAQYYGHSTAIQAAQVAKDAQVKALLLGHYSKRYADEEVLLTEAKTVFDNTYLSNEKLVFEV